ncbi:MAG TPA: hypothetical protein VF719_05945, partial [Abditibacteriaceae bacterium]
MKSSRYRVWKLLACLLLANVMMPSTNVWASPRSDAWKLRQSNPEEALRQLQAVVQADPRDAKGFWFMTLVQKDLNRPADALQSLESARRIDPQLGFSSAESVEKIERALRRATSRTNAAEPAPQSTTEKPKKAAPPEFSDREMLAGLARSGVYVAPSMRARADAGAIAAEVRRAKTKTNVVVIDR